MAGSTFALPAKRQSSARPMENLGRGVTAVRPSSNSTFISWRLLGLDPDGIGFNVHRSTNGADATRLLVSIPRSLPKARTTSIRLPI